MLIEEARGLFKRGISQSGLPTSGWMRAKPEEMHRRHREVFEKLGKGLNCFGQYKTPLCNVQYTDGVVNPLNATGANMHQNRMLTENSGSERVKLMIPP